MLRDHSTISPSARSLLLLKAQTSLPYARQAAEALFGTPLPDPGPAAEMRRFHFEERARSLDEALAKVKVAAVLELASGLSFRGLELAERAGLAWCDTDLTAMADLKRELLPKIHPGPLPANYAVRALNALDPIAFKQAVAELPAGPIAVIHEGLLMYLDDAEKQQLASNVREALRARGGYWITADVYVQMPGVAPRDARTQAFIEKHKVDEQKFTDLPAAEAYFTSQGFRIAERSSSSPVRATWTMEI